MWKVQVSQVSSLVIARLITLWIESVLQRSPSNDE